MQLSKIVPNATISEPMMPNCSPTGCGEAAGEHQPTSEGEQHRRLTIEAEAEPGEKPGEKAEN